MPKNAIGAQTIGFAVVINGGDYDFSGRRDRFKVTKRFRTCLAIAGRFGQVERAPDIKKLNKVRSITHRMKVGRVIKLPRNMRSEASFQVMAGESAPQIISGYPKVEIIDRANRTGISVFKGFDPIVMQVPIQFESMDRGNDWITADGTQVEKDIAELERMAGRGRFKGAAVGQPSIVEVSTLGDGGVVKPLIPSNYQSNGPGDVYSPIWWISGLDWDADPVRNRDGQRIRQLATVELMQYIQPKPLSAAQRKRARPPSSFGGGGGGGKLGKGGAVLWVGDSLGKGTVAKAFGNANKYIARDMDANNVKGRNGRDTLAYLRNNLKDKHHVVVFDAGTNDMPYNQSGDTDLLADVARAVGDRKLVICTISSTASSTQGINQGRKLFAEGHDKRVVLYNWNLAVIKHNIPLAGAGVHPDAAGYKIRAKGLADKISGGV